MSANIPPTHPRKSATFDDYTMSEIRRAAATGIYDIRGGGAKRKVPNFDDLLFLGASMSRYPLEGYRETCGTNVVLGSRYAKNPIELDYSDNYCRHEFWITFCPGERGFGARRIHRRNIHHHRRWRDDSRKSVANQKFWSINICPRAMA